MIADRWPARRDLPVLTTLLCLYGAGWVGGVAGEVVSGGPLALAMAQMQDSLLPLLLVQVATALVGGVVLRYLLRYVLGWEISLAAAVVALFAGGLVRTIGYLAVIGTSMRRGEVLVSLLASPAFLVLGLIATYVSFLVLRQTHRLQPSVPLRSPDVDPVAPYREQPETFEHASYDERVDALRETSAGLVGAATRARPDELADIVVAGVSHLEAALDALRRATPPPAIPARLHRELVDAAGAVREELLAAAREAALGVDPRLRLADSEGLRRMRQTLYELAELGVARDW